MSFIAGIDEAGYGPILGPLVVSSVAFRVDDDGVADDLWEALAEAVARRPGDGGGRIVVADSKELKRGDDLVPLEESALAFFRAAGFECGSLPRALASFGASAGGERDEYPWYGGLDLELPVAAESENVDRLAERLKAAMDKAGVSLCGVRSDPMHVKEFNEVTTECRNKALASGTRVMDLLEGLWERYAAAGLRVAVDKQGGRNRYAPWLHACFFGCRIHVEKESSQASAYVVSGAGRGMKVAFEPRADARHFAVALASMVSKYVRELFMCLLNNYWRERVPGLRPTAGYVTDGRRFLSEIAKDLEDNPALVPLLVRER